MPNVFSHPYQSDKSISNLRQLGVVVVVVVFLIIIQILKETSVHKTVKNLIRRRILFCVFHF